MAKKPWEKFKKQPDADGPWQKFSKQEPIANGIPDELKFDPKEDLIQKQDETAMKPIDELKSATRSEMLALNKVSQEFDETGASQALGSFNKAIVSGVAALPKSVAILAKKLDDFTGVPSKPIEEYSTYQMGDWLEKKAAEVGITATDPARDGFLNTQVPQALGSVAAIVLTGGRGLTSNAGKELLVNAPKGILGTVKSAVTNPATVSGGLQMAVPEYEAAKAAGMNDDEAFTVFLKNYGVGQTEALPLARAFSRINKITGGNVVEILKAGTQGGLEEGTQELIQTYMQNQIAKGSYDPERDPLMGMLEAGNTGFFVGFILPGVRAALTSAPQDTRKKVEAFINEKLKSVSSEQTNSNEKPKEQVEPVAATEVPKVEAQESVPVQGEPEVKGEKVVNNTNEGFQAAGETSKKEQSPNVLGNWIVDNAQTGDKIKISEDEYYDVSRRKTKNGFTEIELQLFVRNEETGEFENVPEGVKLLSDKNRGTDLEKLGTSGASNLFEYAYTDSEGNRKTQKSEYIPKTTGEAPVITSESKDTKPVVGEEVSAEQGSDAGVDEFNSVGENYVKRNGKWFVKDSDGVERPVISEGQNESPEVANAELADLRKLKSELEKAPEVTIDLSPTGKGKIARMDAFTPEGRARKWLLSGGKLLWNSKNPGPGKKLIRGIKDETGYSNRDKAGYEKYLSDKDGVSVEKAAESLADFYQDDDVQKYRNAILEVFSTDPKSWYEQQVKDEDPGYGIRDQQRAEELEAINQQINELESTEEALKTQTEQLYENERRVDYGITGTQTEGAGSEIGSQEQNPRDGREASGSARALIRENGNADKSQQALAELQSLTLTHVPGLGMGQNQAKGTYVSTESQNRYETEGRKPLKATVSIQNPFVSDGNVFYDIQRQIIQGRFGKESIEDLNDTEMDLLAEMVTEHFITEGYDSIYFPQTESQEGELVVFDRNNVTLENTKLLQAESQLESELRKIIPKPDAFNLVTNEEIISKLSTANARKFNKAQKNIIIQKRKLDKLFDCLKNG